MIFMVRLLFSTSFYFGGYNLQESHYLLILKKSWEILCKYDTSVHFRFDKGDICIENVLVDLQLFNLSAKCMY